MYATMETYHNQDNKHFSHAEEITHAPFHPSLHLHSQANTHLPSVTIDWFAFLEFYINGIHIGCTPGCLAYFNHHVYFKSISVVLSISAEKFQKSVSHCSLLLIIHISMNSWKFILYLML